MWIWNRPGWPQWEYALRARTVAALRDIAAQRRRLAAQASESPELLPKAVDAALFREASATSEIEGEHISYDDLRNAVAGNPPAPGADSRAEGVVRMLRKCRAAEVLDRATLFDMHESLLGHLRGSEALGRLQQIGAYRKTHVHIRSRAKGILYEAPGPEEVERLMANFLHWAGRPLVLPMNATPEPLTEQTLLLPVKAAISHMWFERIHPFSDGNGRIGRAIAERILRGSGKGAGYLATAIDVRRERYYEALGEYGKEAQGNDITAWIAWFVDVCRLSLDWEWERILFERDREAFFRGAAADLTMRVQQAIDAILDHWPGGRFYSGVDEQEWASLVGSGLAQEEGLDALCERGILSPGSESGRYTIVKHFRNVSERLFEVGVHWIPIACDK